MRERVRDRALTLARAGRAAILTDMDFLMALPQPPNSPEMLKHWRKSRWLRSGRSYLEIARSIARAELDLVQIRQANVALIARMSEFGELEVPIRLGLVVTSCVF